MTKDQEIASAEDAAGRLFRAYERHCLTPDPDTLFTTLEALHSLNDRLEKATGRGLLEIEEFVALKALRNFMHHEDELHANVRVIPTPALSDVIHMCIVRRDQVERAIEGVNKNYRDESRAACHAHFHWYGDAVNINPALFNAVVRAYELLVAVEISPPDDVVVSFVTSYAYEAELGLSHYVDGRLTANAAAVSAIFTQIVADLPGI